MVRSPLIELRMGRNDAMEYRDLGKTGVKVSGISLGTVSLGMNYGIPAPGEWKRPDESEAVRLLRTAFDRGVNLFDTAPGYGKSENLTGSVLGHLPGCLIATKISIPLPGGPETGCDLRFQIRDSVAKSLERLGGTCLDILQIHNATCDLLDCGIVLQELSRLREEGLVRFLGASIYTVEEALAAIRTGLLEVLQVPLSILDQRMLAAVEPAKKAGVALIARSVLLKGALTRKAAWLPSQMNPLKQAVDRVRKVLECSWEELPQYALRYALSLPGFASVLVGVRTAGELERALDAVREGPLPRHLVRRVEPLGLDDPVLYNPARWPIK